MLTLHFFSDSPRDDLVPVSTIVSFPALDLVGLD